MKIIFLESNDMKHTPNIPIIQYKAGTFNGVNYFMVLWDALDISFI